MQKTLSLINLSAIESNAIAVRNLLGNRFFWAVVKANAYGHGAVEVARKIENIVDGFCVAIVSEGVELRLAGITKPILVLAPPLDFYDVETIKFYNLTATVVDERSAKLTLGCARHLKINTGMNRYGCHGTQLERVLEILPKNCLDGAYSHMYCADDEKICGEQLQKFQCELQAVKAHSPNAQIHFAASGGILRGEKFLFDGARCGLLLYGYAPSGFRFSKLTPALKVFARRAQITEVTGGGVGYNRAEEKYNTLTTYRLGYADGFWRTVPLGEKTLCMDAFISKINAELLPVFDNAESYAKSCGTISYEVLCSVTARSQRIYIG